MFKRKGNETGLIFTGSISAVQVLSFIILFINHLYMCGREQAYSAANQISGIRKCKPR